jgi:Ran GTPase-activating protein (RanGAP) involved in mRNA processing and transport
MATLRVSGPYPTEEQRDAAVTWVGQHTDLKELCMSIRGCESLASILSGLSGLVNLTLYQVRIGEDGVGTIVPELRKLLHLSELTLSKNVLGSRGISAVAPSVSLMKALKVLEISHNGIGSSGPIALAQDLVQLGHLKSLKVPGNDVQYSGAMAIVAGSSGLRKFKSLDLSENGIADEGKNAELGVNLRRLNALTSLNLCKNNLSTITAIELTKMSLTVLDLAANQVSPRGCRLLMEAGRVHTLRLEGQREVACNCNGHCVRGCLCKKDGVECTDNCGCSEYRCSNGRRARWIESNKT